MAKGFQPSGPRAAGSSGHRRAPRGGAGPLGQRAEDRMPADPAEPVGGVAGIGLAAMGDAVPVGREPPLAQVVGRLGGLVAGVPEIVDLEQAGGQGQPRRAV